MTAQSDPDDTGTDGPAMARRPRRILEWQRKITATRVVTERREVLADVHIIDVMSARGQLSDRQTHAALRLYGLFLAAGLEPRQTPRHAVVHDTIIDSDHSEAELPAEEARVVYRRLLRDLGPISGMLLDALMHNEHPGTWRLAAAQDALDRLAEWWGMEKS